MHIYKVFDKTTYFGVVFKICVRDLLRTLPKSLANKNVYKKA